MIRSQSTARRTAAWQPIPNAYCGRQVALIERELLAIGTGWFCVGGRWEVPGDACYVGRYRNCWVWIPPEGREQLTEFTLATMKLSALLKETQTLISPGSVKISPGDKG